MHPAPVNGGAAMERRLSSTTPVVTFWEPRSTGPPPYNRQPRPLRLRSHHRRQRTLPRSIWPPRKQLPLLLLKASRTSRAAYRPQPVSLRPIRRPQTRPHRFKARVGQAVRRPPSASESASHSESQQPDSWASYSHARQG